MKHPRRVAWGFRWSPLVLEAWRKEGSHDCLGMSVPTCCPQFLTQEGVCVAWMSPLIRPTSVTWAFATDSCCSGGGPTVPVQGQWLRKAQSRAEPTTSSCSWSLPVPQAADTPLLPQLHVHTNMHWPNLPSFQRFLITWVCWFLVPWCPLQFLSGTFSWTDPAASAVHQRSRNQTSSLRSQFYLTKRVFSTTLMSAENSVAFSLLQTSAFSPSDDR